MDKLKGFDLNIVMTDILQHGVFMYDSGLWMYYLSDIEFGNDDVFSNQSANEDFAEFVERTLCDIMIMEDEKCKEIEGYEPLVTINYAIYGLKKL